jgi:alanine racemase
VDTTRAWAEIDLDALTHNLRIVRRSVGTGVAVILVAKANAYGHGAIAIAHHAFAAGVQAIAVTTCAEAVELRESGVSGRVLVMGAVLGDEALAALELGCEISIPSAELLRMLESTAQRLGRVARVHLKIDTGMHRLGVPPSGALPLLERIRESPHLELAGVMTHIAATDGTLSGGAQEQIQPFLEVLEPARERGLLRGRQVWVHAANSACVLTGMRPLFDAVRPGACAYGLSPHPHIDGSELRPVMSVRTKIVHMQEIAEGSRVGYGGTWTARRRARIATLPVGYDDGVDWRLGNRGAVLVRGTRAPIVGRISMDYTTVDVTDVPCPRLGEGVTLLGADGAERIRAEDLAAVVGGIPYEVTCSIGKRVRRVFLGGDALAQGPGNGGSADGPQGEDTELASWLAPRTSKRAAPSPPRRQVR